MLGIKEGIVIPEIQIKNLVIMLGKYFIFKIYYQKQHPTLIRFRSHLCQRIQIEKTDLFHERQTCPVQYQTGYSKSFD